MSHDRITVIQPGQQSKTLSQKKKEKKVKTKGYIEGQAGGEVNSGPTQIRRKEQTCKKVPGALKMINQRLVIFG